MKWSLRLGTLAGIPVYVHATFALLLVWIGFASWSASGSLGAALSGVVFLIALFGCVLLHELGHALAARRYGIPTRDITLLPIGGIARLEKMPERPIQELWVALAGPAVNVAIAAALSIWLLLTQGLAPLEPLGVSSGSFVQRLLLVNVILVVFNMVPAFPMDGGRVLRALLAMRLDYVRATRFAASLGQGMALLFGFVGLLVNPFLIFIALFVWIGAAQESAAVQTRSALEGAPVSSAMLTDYRSLDASDSLSSAVGLMLAGSQRNFPVLDRGELVGVLTQRRLLETLSREGPSAPVARATDPVVAPVDAREMLDVAMKRMQAAGSSVAPVLDGGRMVGVLTMENVAEFMSIRDALGGEMVSRGSGLDSLLPRLSLAPGPDAARG
jgi:Zn-dependent protease/CBS domain-containing protein